MATVPSVRCLNQRNSHITPSNPGQKQKNPPTASAIGGFSRLIQDQLRETEVSRASSRARNSVSSFSERV